MEKLENSDSQIELFNYYDELVESFKYILKISELLDESNNIYTKCRVYSSSLK